jgi:hypothetical protein
MRREYYLQTYKTVPASSENNHVNDFSGSDNDFLGFYDE